MADKPNQEFGRRNKVSVPAAPRPVPPPAKRSGHVALLLMGTFAVGTAAYTLIPNRTCEQPSNAYGSPTQTTTECSSRSSSSSSGGGSGGGSSGRSSYYSSGDSSSSSSSSHSSYDSGSHAAQRGGFGSFGHAIGFSGG
ncbi:hypothetical protein CQ14_40415 [Bradyrhizobium lablabi]|uniref:Uncharacterized protein n=1 Tax=Bradyrhizobium lablabi TaxID=722472 RepID=A0A0R3MB16_9BRAD|nr:hypothetical protein [Bradyrhizobium lablabi]KRR17474.1 hypothetical protein CQ14_40415 [Bradyrhizobium lablabi]